MSFVVTIEDVSPAPRADGIAWNRARFEQAPAALGPWTPLETIALDPLDADPREPQSRELTTTLATLDPGFFRIVFLDPADNEQASDPVFSAPIGTAYTSVGAVRSALAPDGQQGPTGGTAASLPDHQLQNAIIEAANEINARISSRYALPLSVPIPQIVESLNRDIAAYMATLTYRRNKALADDDPVSLRYQRAQKLLDGIGSGKVALPIVGGTETTSAEAAVANLYEGDLFGPEDFDLATDGARPRWQGGSEPDWS